MESVTWQKMALIMLAGVALLVGLFTLLMLRRLAVRHTDQVQRLYLKFCRKLEKAGIARAAHEGPQDFTARAAQMKPQRASAIKDITARYVALRYNSSPLPLVGRGTDGSDTTEARRAVASFKL